jgi:hypothetical protein
MPALFFLRRGAPPFRGPTQWSDRSMCPTVQAIVPKVAELSLTFFFRARYALSLGLVHNRTAPPG